MGYRGALAMAAASGTRRATPITTPTRSRMCVRRVELQGPPAIRVAQIGVSLDGS